MVKIGLVGFLLWSPFLFGQTDLKIEWKMNWTTGVFQLDITAPTEGGSNQPTGRYKTERRIEREGPVIIGQTVQNLVVDSRNTLEELVRKTPSLLRDLENLSKKVVKVFTIATGDRNFLTVRYNLEVFPHLAKLLVKHNRAYRINASRGYTPNEEFTGIIIYAGEKMPVHEEGVESAFYLTPSLFPKIYDPSMNLIHSLNYTDPEAVLKWGSVGYGNSFNLANYSDRIGFYPLRTTARWLYGSNRTDIIISEEAAKMLTSSENNRELLRQGRVVIIIPPDSPSDSPLPPGVPQG